DFFRRVLAGRDEFQTHGVLREGGWRDKTSHFMPLPANVQGGDYPTRRSGDRRPPPAHPADPARAWAGARWRSLHGARP
ncbi:hypothetical protein B8W90_11770, partial [Staphylococcus hominis]